MPPEFTGSQISPKLLVGEPVPEAEDRQRRIPDFDQDVFSSSGVECIGAGGIVSHIAPTLARKGIGYIKLLDHDQVEASNLNRQRFYSRNIGENKAVALARNLVPECIRRTRIIGIPLRFEEAVARGLTLAHHLGICGVDNNPARVAVSRYYRAKQVPVIFAAVSRDGDHGYVFVQDRAGPCIGCVFPDIINDDRFPCPGTPAIADILQAVGALAVYAVDTLLMSRPRSWNLRRMSLSDGTLDGSAMIPLRAGCPLCD